MGKENTKGNYICKVEYFDIYLKGSFDGDGKKKTMKSHQYDIYHAKRLVEGGFKAKELAVAKANELFQNKVTKPKNKK